MRWLTATRPAADAVLATLLMACLAGPAAAPASAAEATKPRPCSTPEYRQLDFWVGDWDAYEADSSALAKEARLHVDRILDGCVLLEDYLGTNGAHGQSFSLYDAARKVWHQSWVTNRGKLLIVEGTLRDGEMVLEGTDHATGELVRGLWKPVKGGVRETAVTSADGGKTWKPWFDLVFRPHQP